MRCNSICSISCFVLSPGDLIDIVTLHPLRAGETASHLRGNLAMQQRLRRAVRLSQSVA